ncbi:MAG: Flp family type IVb pilin [Candidatus Hydrogenedentota bacterium]|nr:MAG: Flp family type IVb pilin [Candidatus Hydrogenedentota bacterium]
MIDIREITEESGQGMVEYGLIIGLIAIIVIAVFVALGGPLKTMFQDAVSTDTMGKNQAALSAGIY